MPLFVPFLSNDHYQLSHGPRAINDHGSREHIEWVLKIQRLDTLCPPIVTGFDDPVEKRKIIVNYVKARKSVLELNK